MQLSFSIKNALSSFGSTASLRFLPSILLLIFVLITSDSFAVFTDIYSLSEDNPLAATLCKAISYAQLAMIPIAGIMLSVAAFGAFKGSFSPSMLITFAIGMAIAKNPGPLLQMISPDTDLEYACKCNPTKKVIREARSADNVTYWQEYEFSTGVDEDCNPIK